MSLHTDIPVLLLIFAPLVAAVISLVGKFFSPRYSILPAFAVWFGGSVWALIASGAPILAGESLLYTIGGWAEPYGIILEVNGLTWIATLTDILIGTTAWLQTRRYRRFDPLFYFFFFMALFSLQGVLYTRDLFNLFVWFEVLSLSSFMLITYDQKRSTYVAAVRYLLISTVSIIFFLLGVWILYISTGSLSLPTIAAAVSKAAAETGEVVMGTGLAIALMSGGILTRAAVIPFHTWLPEAHAAAPYPISALLSGFVIKAPMLALWRIYDYISFPMMNELLIWIGAVCALTGVGAAMVQRDAKKLLGYHSVSQMGYIVAAFGVGGPEGKVAALFYIIGHALFKSLLFLTVGRVTERISNRNVYEVRGMGRVFPIPALLFMVAAFSISGVPLFAGFTAKLLVGKALYSHGIAYWMLTIAGVGTAASFFKLGRIFIGSQPRGDGGTLGYLPPDISTSKTATSFADLGTAVLAGGCLLMGVIPAYAHSLFLRLIEAENLLKSSIESPVESSVASNSIHSWYAPPELLKASLVLGAGFFISIFLVSGPGKKLAHFFRARTFGLNGSLRLLTAGFLFFILFGVFFF
ncbi:MAG: complex I subunit 5 family protein [Spirochaetaceae bacterium]